MPTIQQFCVTYGLPDLSPLVNSDCPTRHVLVWKVMQTKLRPGLQRAFLLDFCQKSGVPALQTLSTIIKPNMDIAECSNMMELIMSIPGFNTQALGDAMKEFCNTHDLSAVSALNERFGDEVVVYSIAALFPPVNGDMRDELDVLKFNANDHRFLKELQALTAKNQAEFDATMTALNKKKSELEAENAALQHEYDSCRCVLLKRKRQG